MIQDLANYSPKGVKQAIVIDAGIAIEDNLKSISEKGYQYVCVSRKRLNQYKRDSTKNSITQLTDRGKNKVELVICKPEEYYDTWMQVKSDAKRIKQASTNDKLTQRFEEELPTDKKTIHLRKPSKPTQQVQQIYKATKCKQTQSAVKKYVVYH